MSLIVRQQLQKDVKRLINKSKRLEAEKDKANVWFKDVTQQKKDLDLEIAELTLHLDNLGGPVTKEELASA